ncbi:hypothetical protein [Pseudooceanicola sp.]|uniref:hypothetical protein n=1 Tax=Pseudooceanicola sp. TaxID=1914328 RepID=UPI0040599CC3
MTFNPVSILLFTFRNNKWVAAERATRWQRARAKDARLVTDLIEMSGLLALPAERLEDGTVLPEPIDPIRMAQERGEQIMAKKLLALMGVTTDDLNFLMMESHYEMD